jgi:heme A synthase
MDTMKKIVSYTLIAMVLIFTVVAVLGIWKIIDLKNVLMNAIYSLIVIFAASAVILFIYTVFMRDTDKKELP